MTFRELVAKADEGYRDNTLDLMSFVLPNGKIKREKGDALALFIVLELKDTFDADASDDDQLSEAYRVIEVAIEQLQNVLGALS